MLNKLRKSRVTHIFIAFMVLLSISLSSEEVLAYNAGDQIPTIPAIGNRLSPTLNATGDPLIFVDMPEVINSQTYSGGMKASYRDTVNAGRFRLMYYHQNKSGKALYYCVALTNKSNSPVDVYWNKIGIGENTDAAALGATMTKDWLNKSSTDGYWGQIPAQKTKYFTIRKVDHTYTGSAMIDFRVTGAVTVSTLITDTSPTNDTVNGVPSTPILNAAVLPWIEKASNGEVLGITRGKWDKNKLTGTIDYRGTNGNSYVTLGNDDRQSVSPWLQGEKISGYSAVDKKSVVNYGNYGVEYAMNVNLSNPWPGYTKFDSVYFDIAHGSSTSWFYSYFVGKVNGTTKVSPKWVNSNTRGWVLDKRAPGSYTLSTMVPAGSNHPIGILFLSDN